MPQEISSLPSNPLKLFERWLKLAEKEAQMHFSTAMALATANKKGQVSVRQVLLKGVDAKGFYFFTNYQSQKAHDLAQNPHAALCFFWDQMHKQVRVEGKVKKLTKAESQAYFHTRPRLSQIGAWASSQSREIPSRKYLVQRVKYFENKFSGKEIPLPPFWGGYVLQAKRIEFWIEGKNRLHDRFEFKKVNGKWKKRRLSP